MKDLAFNKKEKSIYTALPRQTSVEVHESVDSDKPLGPHSFVWHMALSGSIDSPGV